MPKITYIDGNPVVSILDSGQIRYDQYGNGTFQQNDEAIALPINSNGEIVEAALSGFFLAKSYAQLRAYEGTLEYVYLENGARSGWFILDTTNPVRNGGTVIRGDDGRKWRRIFDEIHYSPEWWQINEYGLTSYGDTILNAADQFNAILTLTGGNVVIELGKDKEYLIDLPIYLDENIIIEGNGATIKADDSISTTLAVAATAGDATITVADASNFRVGQVLNIFSGNASNQNQSNLLIINDITGNNITFTQGIASNAAVGEVVATSYYMFARAATDLGTFKMRNVTLDGNKDNRTETVDWDKNVGMNLTACDSTLDSVYFINMPTETMIVDRGIANNCHWRDIGGSGIHFSNTTSSDQYSFIMSNCTMYNTNINDNALASHSEAVMTWSFLTGNIMVSNCKFELADAYLFGKISADDPGRVIINGCIIEDISEGIIPVVVGANAAGIEGFTLTNSYLINCGTSTIAGLPGAQFKSIIFKDNHLINTVINFDTTNILELIQHPNIGRPDYTGKSLTITNANTAQNLIANPGLNDILLTTVKYNNLGTDTTPVASGFISNNGGTYKVLFNAEVTSIGSRATTAYVIETPSETIPLAMTRVRNQTGITKDIDGGVIEFTVNAGDTVLLKSEQIGTIADPVTPLNVDSLRLTVIKTL